MMTAVDDQRVGRTIRTLRQRKGWRQADLAAEAGCSQNLISLVERGHLDRVAIRVVRRIVASLDGLVTVDIRWRGAALDRLIDEAHATVVGFVANRLRTLGWDVEIEVTYSEFGERGSIDILAWHSASRTLLVIEVKTDLPSAELTLRKLDEKTRLAGKIGRQRFGWQALNVSRLLVMPASMTLRRRVARHAHVFDRAVPDRGVVVRQWLASPSRPLAGVWFVSDRDAGVVISAARSRERVRRAKPVPANPRGDS